MNNMDRGQQSHVKNKLAIQTKECQRKAHMETDLNTYAYFHINQQLICSL